MWHMWRTLDALMCYYEVMGTNIQTRDLTLISRALGISGEKLPFHLRCTACVQTREAGFGATNGDALKLTEVTASHIWKTG